MNKLGFGFLRLPRTDPEDDTTVDFTVLNEMVDTFLASGGTYFDTAYTYLGGMSETAVRRALVERYPRSAFTLADKLPSWKVKKKEDCERYFAEQCGRCGVDYFDIYLLHWLNRENYAIAEQFDEFAFLQKPWGRRSFGGDLIGASGGRYRPAPDQLSGLGESGFGSPQML